MVGDDVAVDAAYVGEGEGALAQFGVEEIVHSSAATLHPF